MNIEKWIEEKRIHSGITYSGNDVYSINAEDLLELLKTHAIVPREPSDEQLFAMSENENMHDYDYMRELYLSAIKAAENE